MIHEFNLNPVPFELIRTERKDIEMRLYDEKRKNIEIGDLIRFTNNQNDEKLTVEVVNLYRFDNFEQLYNNFDKERLGYLSNEKADFHDMEEYYSIDKIKEYGVLAIEIKLIV